MNSESVTLTPKAQAHIEQQLQRAGKIGLLLSLKQAGCSGWQYVIEAVDKAPAAVDIVPCGKVQVYILKAQAEQMSGTVVRLEQAGMQQTRLTFKHPRAQGVCGCGESFMWKQ